MQPIPANVKYSRPHLLHESPRSQVVRCAFRDFQGAQAETQICVLKFFPGALRPAFDREVAIYGRLIESNDDLLRYPKPLGFAEWTTKKYEKVIGRKITRMIGNEDDIVYVLMLEFLESTTLTNHLSLELVKSALSSLGRLHRLGIVHGDISASNVLILPDNRNLIAVWIDFSYSWTDASERQISLERDRARNYFASLVFSPLASVYVANFN